MSGTLKILYVTDTYLPNVNGSAVALHRLTTQMSKRGHKIFVLAPSTSFKNYTAKDGDITIFRVRSLLLQKIQEFRVSPWIFHRLQLIKIIDQIKPDLVHINNPGFLAQSAIKVCNKENIPIIGTNNFMVENLIHYLHLPDKIDKVIGIIAWKQFAKMYNKLDLVIAPTEAAARLLKSHKINAPTVVLSNGIDLKIFNPKNDGSYLKRRWNLKSVPIILYVGRIDFEKKLVTLIKAAVSIKERYDFQIVLAGKGKEEGSLKKLVKRLGISDRIFFAGFIQTEDLPNVYRIADIFVIPGIAELQSLVTMEAMASGLPAVGANAVALPHLIQDDQNGYLFERENHFDLADKLSLLLQNKQRREKMGRLSLKIIKEHDINKIMDKLEKIYYQVVKGKK